MNNKALRKDMGIDYRELPWLDVGFEYFNWYVEEGQNDLRIELREKEGDGNTRYYIDLPLDKIQHAISNLTGYDQEWYDKYTAPKIREHKKATEEARNKGLTIHGQPLKEEAHESEDS